MAGEVLGMHKALAGIWVLWTLALPWNCMASVFLWGHHQHQNKEGSRVKVMETVNGAGSVRGIDKCMEVESGHWACGFLQLYRVEDEEGHTIGD